jgi:hypothetical protein
LQRGKSSAGARGQTQPPVRRLGGASWPADSRRPLRLRHVAVALAIEDPRAASETDTIVQTVIELAGANHTNGRQSDRAPVPVPGGKALVAGCGGRRNRSVGTERPTKRSVRTEWGSGTASCYRLAGVAGDMRRLPMLVGRTPNRHGHAPQTLQPG